ncbi:MAG: tetratricopeptide repeat protein [Acidobacteria bacterium]|nr:tetratricopeptide repeat protein [Acidobacteriota bacterium]
MQTIVLGVLLLFAMRVHPTEMQPVAASIVAVSADSRRELHVELTARPPSSRLLGPGPEDALLELGRTEAAAGNLEATLEAFRKIEQVPDARDDIVASTALERGRIFDLQGMREKALTEYEKVIRLAVDPGRGRPGSNLSERPVPR